MTAKGNAAPMVALVARANESRRRIARTLRDSGYEVLECEDLSIAAGFSGVVVIERQDAGGAVRAQVLGWLKPSKRPRVVVITSRPVAWKALAMAHRDHLHILAAPSFSWEIVDALRATPPARPRHT